MGFQDQEDKREGPGAVSPTVRPRDTRQQGAWGWECVSARDDDKVVKRVVATGDVSVNVPNATEEEPAKSLCCCPC